MASYRKLLQYSSFQLHINPRLCIPAYNKVSYIVFDPNIVVVYHGGVYGKIRQVNTS